MRFLIGILIFTLAVFLNSIELSLSSNLITPYNPEAVPEIPFYANREGELIPLIAGSMPQPVTNHIYVLGVRINGHLHPFFDRYRRWILLEYHTGQTVIMSPALYHTYGHLYPRQIILRLLNRNNEALVMPARPVNRPVNRPANRQVNGPAIRPANEPVNGPTNRPANEPANRPANEPVNGPVNGPANRPANGPH